MGYERTRPVRLYRQSNIRPCLQKIETRISALRYVTAASPRFSAVSENAVQGFELTMGFICGSTVNTSVDVRRDVCMIVWQESEDGIQEFQDRKEKRDRCKRTAPL